MSYSRPSDKETQHNVEVRISHVRNFSTPLSISTPPVKHASRQLPPPILLPVPYQSQYKIKKEGDPRRGRRILGFSVVTFTLSALLAVAMLVIIALAIMVGMLLHQYSAICKSSN